MIIRLKSLAVLGSVLATGIASELQAGTASPWTGKPVVCYVVQPMSSLKRLPDVIPVDGEVGDQLKIVAAKGEFEPASFVVKPLKDIARFELKSSGLQGEKGKIPVEAVDIKVVKCWYQGGTAWHSYFGDPTKRELVPELLLNDDSLIKVDYKTKDNYLRVDYPEGSRYVWVSYTSQNDAGFFNHDTEPVADSKALMPLKLSAGENKQFWITVKVPENAAAGNYSGKISLVADGQAIGAMTLNLRVLPFTLPEPKTCYDLDKDFYASIYNHCGIAEHMKYNGNNMEQASKKLLAEYANMRDHGCLYPLVPNWDRRNSDNAEARDAYVRQLEILKKSGLKTKPVFGAVKATDYWTIFRKTAERENDLLNFKKQVDEEFAIFKKVLGHNDVYAIGWDEPSMQILVEQRDTWKYIHEKGGRIMSTSKDKHLIYAGFNEDFSNYGGSYTAEGAGKWHLIGGRVATYASPHTGPENPDFIRRTHGMNLYKADLDGTCNYMYYEGDPNIWNEFNKTQYRSFCMVYPTKEDVIDTLEWEGFREGIDDIRYATKLRQVATQAIATGNVDNSYAGKIALQWLANLDDKTADLNAMRLEMINYILSIQAALDGGKK